MKRKVNVVEAAPPPTCTSIGPEDMVLVACASGETYLIERNCALLSLPCRETLLMWESSIRRLANQSRNEQSTNVLVTPIDAVVVGFPISSGGPGDRGGGVRVVAGTTENINMTIPYMSAWDFDGDQPPTKSPLEARVQHLPILTVAERYQQRVDAITPSKMERPSSSKSPSSHGERKGVMVVPKPISPLAPLEGEDGSLLYPVIQLPYATHSLVESSLVYACKKYKMDMDGDKMPAESVPSVNAIATGEQWQMIAAAVLTGI
ncbi:hypothetical protein ABL78_2616 [Leptomonas seymouri]|uniref:Uncharacterized protein n=1 Tax=Leptomonas seymouri TaxID=5684 RepID=A0A0N0P7G9_LEPSE|nr:hypothetical protein ABL78_2616 [Leptomonas seymouri]|eukprot:KPI88317.1 hypothetical protein ABL78_2616 [Leptomonas seymouri]